MQEEVRTDSPCKLSIVVPVYNGISYIRNCLTNLQRQTFQDWEVIFVDDGSTDSGGYLMDQLAVTEYRCQVLHQKNGGTARARNTGLERASGQYITFLDVDDELDPHMYETLIQLMEQTGADMGICGYYFKIEQLIEGRAETTYLEKKSYPDCILRGREQIREKLTELWDTDMLSNVWNKVYRMDLIRDKHLRYRDGHVYTEDRVFNRLFLENCDSIAVTGKCLYYYVRERAGSTSEKFREDYFDIRYKEYLEFQQHFKNMDSWNETSREYVCREFTERISGCLENMFHSVPPLPEKRIKEGIKQVISNQAVQEALCYAKTRSKKMKVLLLPIRLQNVTLTYFIYKGVFTVRKHNPALFHKLKATR